MNRIAKSLALAVVIGATYAAVPQICEAADPFTITTPVASQGLFSCSDLTISASTIDSTGLSVATLTNRGDVRSNGNVILSGGTTVDGNAMAGPGKGVLLSGGSRVTGTSSVASSALGCTPIDLAPLATALAAANNNNTIPLTLQGKNPLVGASRTEFSIGGGDKITLPAGTYYFTKFTVSGGATVLLGGMVRILCTGRADISGGSVVNSSGNPYRLRFWISGTPFTLSSSTLSGFVYAPAAAATVSAGRLIGGLFANTVTVSGGTHMTRTLDDVKPRVTITSPANGSTISDLAHVLVKGTVAEDETAVTVRVNGQAADIAADGTYQITIDLTGAASPAAIAAVATDAAGNSATASVAVTTAAPPAISLTSPPAGALVAARLVDLAGSAGTATSLTVNGQAATIAGGSWSLLHFDLGADGAHALTIIGSGAGGSTTITLTVTSDTTAPAVQSTISPAPNGAGWNRTDVTVSYTCTDATSGVANCPVAVVVSAETASQSVTGTATDRAGNSGGATATVKLDKTLPVVTVTSPAGGATVSTPTVTISGMASDALSGIAGVACNGSATALSGGSFTCSAALVAGDNVISIVATDVAGNAFTTTRHVMYVPDTTQPTITASVTPQPTPEGWNNGPVAVTFICSDAGSGVATCNDPVTLSASGAGQIVTGRAVDAAGNVATASITVNIDLAPPAITGVVFPPAVTNATTATVTGQVADPLAGLRVVRCNGQQATLSGANFTCTVTLGAGPNNIAITADDKASNTGTAEATTLRDSLSPLVSILAPSTPASTNMASIEVSGTATDDQDVTSLTINGTATPVADGTFTAQVSLAEGSNTIAVVATDAAGNRGTASLSVTRITVPVVRITSPADLAVVSNAVIDVTGTLSGPAAQVTVNGAPATLSGSTFTASVPLQQGRTAITAVATTSGGAAGTAAVNIYRDSIPPRLTVYTPLDYDSVNVSAVTVTGMVDDIVQGTVNAGQVRVDINGTPAIVSNRGFHARMPLQSGFNQLTITATDQAGNVATSVLRQWFDDEPRQRLIAVSGDRQRAPIGTLLPQPLVVRFEQPDGRPIAGAPIAFTVIGNNATLSGGAASGRSVSVLTNAQGEASVLWTLGTRAGAANHRVEVRADGIWEPLQLTAIGDFGPPSLIVVDSGNGQLGTAGAQLPRPVVAVVVDRGSNRVANVPVTFSVVDGGGSFDGQASVTVMTDSDGRAIAKPTLGAEAGNDNNVFAATAAGQAAIVTFLASGRVAGPSSATRISGVILDNSSLPIEGVSVRVDGTTLVTQTDAQGQFAIAPAPVGYMKLFVDGSTAHRDGTWPTLEYILYTVPGDGNDLGMPIYLLPIDLRRGILVDDTTGGTLTIPELPGFALTIAAGSAMFPGGGRTGTVSATLVHADKVPMAPGFGQQPKFIVTVQPPGVHFDPPAAVSYPNVDALTPGEITELYSFDHDLGQFIAIGTGTVSEDGSVVRSDPGVGLIKGGWQCSGNPSPTATTSKCGDCKKAQGSSCILDTDKNLKACKDDKNPCTYDICISGTCTHQLPKLKGKFTSPDNFKIQADPRMPVVNFKMQVTGVTPDPTAQARFKWETKIEWRAQNNRLIKLEMSEESGADYTPAWPADTMRGGTLTMSGTLIRGVEKKECFKNSGTTPIIGINPTKATIEAALPDSTTRHIACHESSFRQFVNSTGIPLQMLEPDGRVGVGIMQVTDAPSDEAFWNWSRNVSEGLAEWARKQADAAGFPGRVRRRLGDPTIPDFTPAQLEREALRRFNGGHYWDWDPASRTWVQAPPPAAGDPNYVNNTLNCN